MQNAKLKIFLNWLFAFFFLFIGMVILLGEVHFKKALEYQEKKDFERAEIEFKKSLFLNPNPDYLLVFARFYSEPEKQKLLLKKLIFLKKKDYRAYNFLGRVYLKEEDLKRAEENLKRALQVNPINHPFLYNDLARLYLEQKRYRDGEDLLSKILSFYPEKVVFSQTNRFGGLTNLPEQIASCWQTLGLIYQKQTEKEKEAQAFEKMKKILKITNP